MQKLKFISIAVVLFLTVVFFDQNRAPVPVKIILGDPTPVGLSLVIALSMLLGAVMAITGIHTGTGQYERRYKSRVVLI